MYMHNASPYAGRRLGGNANSRRGQCKFVFGITQILSLVLGVMQILGYLDTNMLVSATQNSRIGGIAQCKCFRVTVEYRLKDTQNKSQMCM